MREVDCRYRLDLGMWETAFEYWVFRFYRYSVFLDGMMLTKWRGFRISPRRAKYFVFKKPPSVSMEHLIKNTPHYILTDWHS